MKFSKDVVISFHQELISRFGGVDGLRDSNLLDHILCISEQTIDHKLIYPTITDQVAILGYSLITRHPFIDGNKRIGMHMVAVYLRYNGYRYSPSNHDVVRIALLVASKQMDYQKFREWMIFQSSK